MRWIAIIVWTMCALGAGAQAQPTPDPNLITADDPSRMKHLAERLAAEPAEPTTPLVQTRGPAADAPGDEAPDATPHTPISPQTSRTPLLKPGSNFDPATGERPGGAAWLLQTLTALGIVIALALGVRFVYGRLGGNVASHASPVVEVLSRTTVAPRSHVLLLRVGGRVLVVSDSSAGMRTLASMDDPQEVADILGAVSAAKPTSISRGFNQLLHKFSSEHEPEDAALAGLADGPGAEPGKVRDSVAGLLARVRSMGREGGAS